MSIVWRKVWRDLWCNKFRTILVVLSTAVGIFAIGLVFGLSDVMRSRMIETHRETIPAHVTFWWISTFDDEEVETVANVPGIAEAEGEVIDRIRWRVEGESDWRDGTALLYAREFESQRLNLYNLVNGQWPAKRALAVDRLTMPNFGVPLGSTIVVEVGRYERRLPVEGIVRNPYVQPPQMGGDPVFFADLETFAWLTGQEEGFHRLHFRLESFSEENANEVAERVRDRLESMGMWVSGYFVTDPEIHPAQDDVDSVFLILMVMGVLSLGLSGFLIINTMNALVAQQVWQIGVMKAVGATGGRVVRVYLTAALAYGLLSLMMAVPVGAVAVYYMGGWLLDLVQTTFGEFRVMPIAIIIQVVVGAIVPLLAALVPVIGGARITPHQAISSYGLGSGFGRNWLDRLIGGIRRLPRSLALSFRNTFRCKARVLLTLVTLMLGGVMFIVVMSTSASMTNTITVLLDDFGFDVSVWTDRFYRVQRLVDATESVPGVVKAEVALRRGGNLSLPNGDEREVGFWGVPPDSEMFRPRIAAGRNLLPEDDHAILLNNKIATDEGFQVGDTITITIDERESTWTVVGLIINVNNDQRDSFMPMEALARATGNVNKGGTIWVTTEKHDLETQQQSLAALREAYPAHRIEASYFESSEEIKAQVQEQFNIVTSLMLVMAVLAAVVGSIGLMSTMSINVVERGREIGVMRATGARSLTIAGIFVAEGVLVGVLSWLLAVPISYPGARLFSNMVGQTVFEIPLDFSYPLSGMLLWLAIVIVLSALASAWPALSATRVSVREALAYE
jgi:putative ABC transport system permease protein